MTPDGRMEIQRGFQYKIKIAFQISQEKKMEYAIINVWQLSSHLELNKIDFVADIPGLLISGSAFFPGNTGDYIYFPTPKQLGWAMWLDLANELWPEGVCVTSRLTRWGSPLDFPAAILLLPQKIQRPPVEMS